MDHKVVADNGELNAFCLRTRLKRTRPFERNRAMLVLVFTVAHRHRLTRSQEQGTYRAGRKK